MYCSLLIITPQAKEMEASFNEKVRLVNCLVSQLIKHKQEIENLKSQHEQDLKNMPLLRKYFDESVEYRTKLVNAIDNMERELNSTSKLFVFKRKRLNAGLKKVNSMLLDANEKIIPVREQLIRTKDRIEDYDAHLKELLEYNYELHLSQLKTAIIDYNKYRQVVEATYGLSLKEAVLEEFVSVQNSGEITTNTKAELLENIKFVKDFYHYNQSEQFEC